MLNNSHIDIVSQASVQQKFDDEETEGVANNNNMTQ